MSINESPNRTSGGLGRALIRLLMRPARVASSEAIGGRFWLVTLEGPALMGAAWAPGQKIQIAMGSAFVARTYTPMDWDAATGRTRFLGHAHGEGPGAQWLGSLAPGAPCDLFGPRPSLGAGQSGGALVVFGDETSMGLVHALAAGDPTRSVACVFEVADLSGAQAVIERLGFSRTALFTRAAGDAHLAAAGDALVSLAASGASFVLTGRAASIQTIRRGLKQRAVAPARIIAKAHWAEGRAEA